MGVGVGESRVPGSGHGGQAHDSMLSTSSPQVCLWSCVANEKCLYVFVTSIFLLLFIEKEDTSVKHFSNIICP